ncbi:amino acid ABC transporter ATP-binding protein [Zavarzinella formosa]|uniref:amino acid ABC transporter ATP-binding protein n=1 Tax=Zavarzinella formosa TaxID=360055 RepID=UPI000315AFB0|nr:amino acid ABC transporter ATP-binding protein [Zavarzinella formosa]
MIQVTQLVKSHGVRRILSDVCMNVSPGTVAAMIGPSGGGKSTLLRCINGLEQFDSGDIRVGTTKLAAKGASAPGKLLDLRRTIGMVFQQFHLFPHMTALENVMAGPRFVLHQARDEARKTAEALLDRVGLSQRKNAKPEQLSGGQQQRVAIARALAVKPQAILFDEPTSALDPKMADEVMGVITDLARQGQTMIVVTHAMSFARQVANHVVVMAEGRVAESGVPGQVFDDPQADVTKDFLKRAGH